MVTKLKRASREMSFQEPQKIVLDMSIDEEPNDPLKDLDNNSEDNGCFIFRICPGLNNFIDKHLKKSAKRIVPLYEIHESHPTRSSQSLEKRPAFTRITIFFLLTFWCFFVFQMIAFILIVMAYFEAEDKNYKSAHSYKKAAWFSLVLGILVPLTLGAFYYFMNIPDYPFNPDAVYRRKCDPGCIYLELRSRCLC